MNQIKDHEEVMMTLIAAARMVALCDVGKAIENADRALSIGPLLDPTLWIQKHKAFEEDLLF